MKAVYYDGEKAVFREDLPIPVPAEGESLIKVLAAAVCNTDKEVLRGYKPDFKGIMGHEFIGCVERSPDHKLIGRRVAGEINAPCGECVYCKTGRYTHCSGRRVLGLTVNGCFAEYLTLNSSLLHIIPDKLSTQDAIYTEPLAAAYEILEQLAVKPWQNIGILGDGRLAYCIAQVLHAEGYEVTVTGRHPEKLKLFADAARVTGEWEPEQYEIVIEATGSPQGIRQALAMVRKKGIIVLKSTYAGETPLPMTQVAVNEITIIGSRCGPFGPAVKALAEGKVHMPGVEWHELSEFEQAFASKAFKSGFLM